MADAARLPFGPTLEEIRPVELCRSPPTVSPRLGFGRARAVPRAGCRFAQCPCSQAAPERGCSPVFSNPHCLTSPSMYASILPYHTPGHQRPGHREGGRLGIVPQFSMDAYARSGPSSMSQHYEEAGDCGPGVAVGHLPARPPGYGRKLLIPHAVRADWVVWSEWQQHGRRSRACYLVVQAVR